MRLRAPARRDLVLPLLLAAAGTLEIATSGAKNWEVGVASFLLASAILPFARPFPLVVPPLVAAIYAVTPLASFDVSPFGSWLVLLAAACFGAGIYSTRARAAATLGSVLVALGVAYVGLEWLTSSGPSLLFGLILTLGPFGLGLVLRAAFDREQAAAASAERARVEAELAGERTVQAERERLAVELHDVLAHTVGEMLVQASAAADLVALDAAAAVRVLEGVAAAGREGLAETGRLLRVLRDDDNELGLGRATREQIGPEPPARRRYADVLAPALLAAIATGEIAVHQGYRPLVPMLACYWLAAAVLVVRRRFPIAMPLAVTAILLAGRLLGLPVNEPASSSLAFALAYFAAGRHVARRRLPLALVSTLASVALLLVDAADRGELSTDTALLLALTIGPWAVGVFLLLTFERTRRHAAAAERTRLEHEREVERATAADRRRVARELHDVLAASLSVMSVQASVAADRAARNAGEAAAAVSEVERAGRRALAEVGRLLRLVRGNDAGTQPQHRLAELPALAADYTRTGLRVELDLDGLDTLPAAIDLSLYRVVQEALTNALKHAPGSTVHVRLERAGASVRAEIVNDCPAQGEAPVPVAGGHGLVGLRERVSLLGGRFQAGRTPAGGFLLSASIPLADAA